MFALVMEQIFEFVVYFARSFDLVYRFKFQHCYRFKTNSWKMSKYEKILILIYIFSLWVIFLYFNLKLADKDTLVSYPTLRNSSLARLWYMFSTLKIQSMKIYLKMHPFVRSSFVETCMVIINLASKKFLFELKKNWIIFCEKPRWYDFVGINQIKVIEDKR